jgi:phenylacetate-CoA ligase
LIKFEINIVATQPLDQQHRDDIYKRMVSQLGNDINLKINEVKEIPRNANGKFKAVISHVKR